MGLFSQYRSPGYVCLQWGLNLSLLRRSSVFVILLPLLVPVLGLWILRLCLLLSHNLVWLFLSLVVEALLCWPLGHSQRVL